MSSTVLNPVPASRSEKLRVEFNALLRNAAVCDLSNRVTIALTGRDRVRWLNGMVTNNIRDLVTGRGVYAFIITPQGRILGDIYAYNLGESLRLETDQAQLEKVLQIFRKYIIMDKVELADKSAEVVALGITGPRSQQTMSAAGMEIPDLDKLQLAETQWQDSNLTVVRNDNDVESYEMWLDPAKLDALRTALIKAGAEPVSAEAVELLRIASGIPRYGQDITERELPHETGQLRALHFSKGCYIGQEIVERIRSRGAVHRQFNGFRVDGPLPAPGTKIIAGEKEVGEITSSVLLPFSKGEVAAALGYVRREPANSGVPLRAADSTLSIAALPFREPLEH